VTNPDIGHRFLRSIAERDWPSLAACFANDAVFYAVIGASRPFREKTGPSEIANQIKAWFQDGDVHQLLDSSVGVLADRLHVRYRIRNRENGSWYVVEQHAFLRAGPEGITRCDLLCSGFMPTDLAPGPQD
jgi:ketosteroid isomerase-like protein